MDKSKNMKLIWKSQGGKKDVLPEPKTIRLDLAYVNPPKNLEEFKERGAKIMSHLSFSLFGLRESFEGLILLHCLYSCEPPKEAAIENLIKATMNLKAETMRLDTEDVDFYKFLKRVLENGYPLNPDYQSSLGLSIDYSKIDLFKKRRIAVQTAAQVKWFLQKEGYLSSVWAESEIIEDKPLYELLEISTFRTEGQGPKTLREWITEINPFSEPDKRGRPSANNAKEVFLYSRIALNPNVFFENSYRVNFIRLKYLVSVLAKILRLAGLTSKDIHEHPVVQAYMTPFNFYPRDYIGDWIDESLTKNCSIYEL